MSMLLKVLLLSLLSCWQCWAYSSSTPDHGRLVAVRFMLEQHQITFGELPSSWEEFDKTIQGAFADSELQPRKRYAFLARGSRARLPDGRGELILLSRRPFREVTRDQWIVGRVSRLSESIRRGISVEGSGYLRVVSFSEEEVQELFGEQGLSLPEPDDLPERPSVTAWKRRKRDSQILLMGVLISGSFIAYCLLRKPK